MRKDCEIIGGAESRVALGVGEHKGKQSECGACEE